MNFPKKTGFSGSALWFSGRKYAKACISGEVSSSALCLIAQASKVPYPYIDSTNVFLSLLPWWGTPSALEMGMLCRLASGHDSAPLSRWREYIIPAIAGSDLSLGDFLWRKLHRTGTKLTLVLRNFAHERGWTRNECKSLAEYHLSEDSSPLSTAHLYHNWARGLVHWTPEYGLEHHSAILALLNQQEALNHRLWRGQHGFLLPQIDKIRLALCAHLNQSYGRHWPYKWQEPENDEEHQAVRDSPFACQLGHMESLLQNCHDLRRERRWISLVRRSRQIRNHLAHYRPISLNEYEAFCREVKRGQQTSLMAVM